MCKKSGISIGAHYLAISIELFVARSQAFRHLDEVNEERIEEEFIANRRNDLELIQDSIRVIEDEVRINVAISLFLQTVKKTSNLLLNILRMWFQVVSNVWTTLANSALRNTEESSREFQKLHKWSIHIFSFQPPTTHVSQPSTTQPIGLRPGLWISTGSCP